MLLNAVMDSRVSNMIQLLIVGIRRRKGTSCGRSYIQHTAIKYSKLDGMIVVYLYVLTNGIFDFGTDRHFSACVIGKCTGNRLDRHRVIILQNGAAVTILDIHNLANRTPVRTPNLVHECIGHAVISEDIGSKIRIQTLRNAQHTYIVSILCNRSRDDSGHIRNIASESRRSGQAEDGRACSQHLR